MKNECPKVAGNIFPMECNNDIKPLYETISQAIQGQIDNVLYRVIGEHFGHVPNEAELAAVSLSINNYNMNTDIFIDAVYIGCIEVKWEADLDKCPKLSIEYTPTKTN